MVKDFGAYPVISQSSKNIDGYYDDSSNVIFDVPVILFGDHTRIVKFIDFPFIPGANGTKIFKTLKNPEYVYYLMQYASFKIENRGYGRHSSLLKKYEISYNDDENIQDLIVNSIKTAFNFIDKIKEQLK